MSKYKCKGCQWYNKPYWSIINPCDNCPRENTNVEIITRWQDPTIEEFKTQLQQKENIIKEVREDLDKQIDFCTNEANGTTNDKYCRIAIQYLKHLKQKLDKENRL